MNNAHRMAKIFMPGDDAVEFDYFVVATMTGVHSAMVKFPTSLVKPFEVDLASSDQCAMVWFITDPQPERDEDGENDATRYQLRGFVYKASMIDEDVTPEEFAKFIDSMVAKSPQDGYVYFPKYLRDGRHEDRYLLQSIEEDMFTTRTTRGMFEEVAWSPFGSIEEATKQDAQNLERNPLMRNWI